MFSSKNVTGWFSRGFYGRVRGKGRVRSGGSLPDKLNPTQRAYYYFPDGVSVVSPSGEKLDESLGIGKILEKTVFRCAAYTYVAAGKQFRLWAKDNIVNGKMIPRRKFLGIFGLVMVLLFVLPSLASGQDSVGVSTEDEVPVLCFSYHEAVDMSKYKICVNRGHVDGPGLMLQMEYDSIPYVEDTDSSSVMVYPGTTEIHWGCLRCGIILIDKMTDWRRPIWKRRELNGEK